MALAELRGIAKSYDGHPALAGLDLEIRAGEVLGLVGPNGAGKTTALRILCGLLDADSGEARIRGLDPNANPLEAKRHLAFVPDGAPLYAHLSARGHLELVGRLHGIEESELVAEAARLLKALDLGDRAEDGVGQFSRGMRQKVALACALLPKPDLLVMDEPLSGLDAPTTGVVKEVLRAWADRGGAVLYTSHLLDVVERVCDRVAVLDQGRLTAEGTLEELRTAAGDDGTLEQVFRALTRAEDPGVLAARVLGDAAPEPSNSD